MQDRREYLCVCVCVRARMHATPLPPHFVCPRPLSLLLWPLSGSSLSLSLSVSLSLYQGSVRQSDKRHWSCSHTQRQRDRET